MQSLIEALKEDAVMVKGSFPMYSRRDGLGNILFPVLLEWRDGVN